MAVSKRVNRAGRVVGYQVAVSVPDPRTGRTVRRVVATFTRRKDADRAERDAKIAVQNGTFELEPSVSARVLTVKEAVEAWFAAKRNSIQENSATGYESAIRLHVLPALGSVPVADLTHEDVQRQVSAWRDAGMGARLLHRCVMILRASLARQVKNGQLPYNVADGLEKPEIRKRGREFMVWTDAQVGAFLAEAANDRMAPFWYLTLIEGMRRGEALGLRWRDLEWSPDELGAVARIAQTVVPDLAHGGRAMIQNRAKTRSSERPVMLTSSTVTVLKAYRDRQRFERQTLSDIWGDHDLIVTTTIGTPVTPSSVKRSLHALIQRANVPIVTTHGLRHMSATFMLKAGLSPALVALKLGHADIGTTVDRYGHLTVNDQSAVNTVMEAVALRGRATRTGAAHSRDTHG